MKVLFGSIITNAIGKIGGQYLKRIPNGNAMNNLMKSKSKKYLQNFENVQFLSFIFREWRNLSDTDRENWTILATTLQFPDKFGNLKYLTARQLFSKCNSQAWRMQGVIVEYSAVFALQPSAVFNTYEINLAINQFDILMTSFSELGFWYIRIDKLRSHSVTPKFKNSKVIQVQLIANTDTFSVWDAFHSKFPNAIPNQSYQISFTSVNDGGILATPIVYKILIPE